MEMNIDYISRETAKAEVRKKFHSLQERCEINEVLNSIPAADVRPVVRGKWGKDGDCQVCGCQPYYERDIHTLNYCPNCGADMRE